MAKNNKQAADVSVDLMFQAFCHRMRLRILHLLCEGEMCVGNLVKVLQAPQPKVSRHLAVLRKAGLVSVRREGQWSHYSLTVAQTRFHERLLDCVANCFDEVAEIRADRVRFEEMRAYNTGCCGLSAVGRAEADNGPNLAESLAKCDACG